MTPRAIHHFSIPARVDTPCQSSAPRQRNWSKSHAVRSVACLYPVAIPARMYAMSAVQCSRMGASLSSIVLVPKSVSVLSPRVRMSANRSVTATNPAGCAQHHVRKLAPIQVGLRGSELFSSANATQHARNAVMSLAHRVANHASHATSASTVMATVRCLAASHATSCHAQSDVARNSLVVTNVPRSAMRSVQKSSSVRPVAQTRSATFRRTM